MNDEKYSCKGCIYHKPGSVIACPGEKHFILKITYLYLDKNGDDGAYTLKKCPYRKESLKTKWRKFNENIKAIAYRRKSSRKNDNYS